MLFRPPKFKTQSGATQPLRSLRVAAVLDEFSYQCFAPEVRLLALDARLWRLQLQFFRPDFLFVESAWRGVRNTWARKIASYCGSSNSTLAGLVSYCKKRSIPTVFWNKEDPVHFDRFIDSARLFDHIFTTDRDRIPDYERACQRKPGTVHPLLFAAQPELHHPRGADRKDTVCFAGSYGEPAFPERRRDLEMLLDAAADFDLVIYDRNSRAPKSDRTFPERFRPYIHAGLDYKTLTDEYRNNKVFLNVNSVTASPTMFARRVFELLACGTAVVSSPSAGLSELFGDVVSVVSSQAEAKAAIARFMEDDEYRARHVEAGMARVSEKHTYEHRLREICAVLRIQG